MRTLLWAAVVLALEVLLLSVYFAVVGMGALVSGNAAMTLLVGTFSVVVWLSFKTGLEQTSKRLVLAVVGCVTLTYAALVVAGPLVEVPAAVVCDRWKTNVEDTSTATGGYFEERRVGPCVLYTHKIRPLGGD